MADRAAIGGAGLATEEARLARAAAGGDGDAFATLYERYARRAYNLAHRLSGSEDDAADAVQEAFVNVMRRLPELGERELAFGSYLFTATRNATYDLMRRQQRTSPSDSIPEAAVPVGAGAGGLGLDPGDPEDDPERRAMLASQQEEIGAANARLPERQREALALRELEELSYDEIAAVMKMNRNSVAQLISRARINLRDELRGTALASIAASSPECERALPLLAMRDDGQLDSDSEDGAWLTAHLAGCNTCGLASEAMQEAGATYRAWVPVAVAPWLFRETAARAAELSGADWSEMVERRLAEPSGAAALPGMPAAYTRAAGGPTSGPRRRRAVAAAAALALLLGGVAAVLAGGSDDSVPPPAAEDAASAAPMAESFEKTVDSHRRQAPRTESDQSRPREAEPAAPAAEPSPEPAVSEPATPSDEADSPPRSQHEKPAKSGQGAAPAPQAVADPKPDPKPEPKPDPPPPPAPPPPATTPPAPPPPSTEPTEPTRPPREPEEPREPREPPAGVPPRG